MKRRKFLRSVSCALILALFVTGLPVQANGTAGTNVQMQTVGQIQAGGQESQASVQTVSTATDNGPKKELTTATQAEAVSAQVLYEVEELREAGTKHFRMSDGTFLAVNYGIPVHYQDADGTWQDIDNSLVQDEAARGTADLQSVSGERTVAFAPSLQEGRIFTAGYKDVEVTVSLLDTAQVSPGLSKDPQILQESETGREPAITFSRSATAELIEDAPAVLRGENLNSTEQLIADVTPENLRQSLIYKEVYPGVDLCYTAYGYDIKEQIIVKKKQETYRYDFLLQSEGLTAVLNEDGSVYLKNSGEEVIYEIPAPYMEDAAGRTSTAVSYLLNTTAQGTVLTVTADAEWINSADGTFPVKIDPTLILRPMDLYKTLDLTFTEESYPDIPENGVNVMSVGAWAKDGQLYRRRGFLYLACMPQLPAGCEVVDARLNLFNESFGFEFKNGAQSFGAFIGAFEVTQSKPQEYATYAEWISKITWNNQPSYDSTNVIDYVNPVYGYSLYHEWDISEIVKKWYATGTDNTMLAFVNLKESQMTADGYIATSFECYKNAPYFFVSYRNTVGIEPYYTYTTLGAGNAGAAYLSDHTGQVKIVREIASYASTVNPFSLNLVYNSDYFANASQDYQPPLDMGTSVKVGAGWSLDAIQYMEEEVITNIRYMRYVDGDGTVHYLQYNDSDGKYYDEDGLGLTVTKVSDTRYEMTDKQDNLWIFENGRLRFYMDNNRTKTNGAPAQDGNRYLYHYNSDKKLTCIEQQNRGGDVIAVATFTYNDAGYLTAITDAAGSVTYLGYSGANLTSISNQSMVLAEYSYAGNRPVLLKDTQRNYIIHLTYESSRVSSFYESAGGKRGAECHVSYPGITHTIYHDYGIDGVAGSDDIYTYCLFDYMGRTVNMYSTDAPVTAGALDVNVLGAGNAVYTQAGSAENTSVAAAYRKNNRITKTAEMGVAAQQLMEDFGLEGFATEGSWIMGVTSAGGIINITTDKPRTGYSSVKGQITSNSSNAKVEASRTTKVLTAGETYTLSAYVNTTQLTGVSGEGVYLQVTGQGMSAKSIPVTYATAQAVDGGWTRLSVTFTPAVTGEHTVAVVGSGIQGTFYADDFQLEKGEAPSSVNLLLNGNMSTPNFAWTVVSGGSYSNGALKLTGEPDNADVKFYQDVPINLPGTESFMVSGWVRANAAPDGEDPADTGYYPIGNKKRCGLRAMIHYSDDTEEFHYVPFDPDVEEWQFASLALVPKLPDKHISYIRIMGTYEKNVNEAYFDNLSLVREDARTMTYDAEGNLVSVASTGLKEEADTYENGNLIKTVTGGNGTYLYTYDSTFTHRLTGTTIEGIGVRQNYGYDAFGNVTSTVLESTSGGKKMQTSATYTGDGNRISSVVDAAGNTTLSVYETNLSVMLGAPTGIVDANGDWLRIDYDSLGRETGNGIYDIVGTSSFKKGEVLFTYEQFRLSEAKRSSGTGALQVYRFLYDDFGNLTTLKAGNHTLASYTYKEKNGPLLRQTYGNGDVVNYGYDKYGRLKTESHETGTLSYTYNGEGQLYSVEQSRGAEKSRFLYHYDILGRLLYKERLDNGQLFYRISNAYNDKNQVTDQYVKLTGVSYSRKYTYAPEDGSLTWLDIDLGHTPVVDHTIYRYFDHLRRVSNVGNGLYNYTYTYRDRPGNSNLTTGQIQSMTYAQAAQGLSFTYGYDSLGNISSYTGPEGTTGYTYDAMGQLTGATKGSTTYAYTYDMGGNLLTASNSTGNHTYTYGDTDWKDLLTAFDGQGITYDGSGNPLSYYNGTRWSLGWADGRQLMSAVAQGGTTITYTYDVDGTRNIKRVGDVSHTYIWEDGKPLQEWVSGNTDVHTAGTIMYFYYDMNGRPYGLQYNGNIYYYLLNAQGDVIRMLDSTGATAASYEYDPFGNIISATGPMAEANPLRYRGYYYDRETGFYYLNSRYYDPKTGRFINADSYVSTGQGIVGYNMFAYCGNNPVNASDPMGDFWLWDFLDVHFAAASWTEFVFDPSWEGFGYALLDTVGVMPIIPSTGHFRTGAEVIDYGLDATRGAKAAKAINNLPVNQGYDSFDKLKKAIGSAGDGNHWHHIVEQSQIQKSGFAEQLIHNTSNIIAVDAATHAKITGFYNTKTFEFTDGLSVRDWLAGRSYEYQYVFGLEVLRQFGVIE